ncbi:nuclear transport factor 2 family protein [Dyella solisilvae]|uniref:Nuclear transport factor 2 family protein n=2 Tax=Dyella solisilvae TaxID=1920168 RepID=A0A370KD69_9GAMM|nr:nuclear transport factor 2 family protein [Dyella solisilvae]
MHAFHQSVVDHDGERLSALFLPQANLFLNVLGDDRLAAARAKLPDAPKVRVSSPAEFAHYVSTTKSALDPVHSHLQVHSDGIIATVYFDFVFNADGKPSNVGNETWQLVKGEQGWRIAAITYSSRIPGSQRTASP